MFRVVRLQHHCPAYPLDQRDRQPGYKAGRNARRSENPRRTARRRRPAGRPASRPGSGALRQHLSTNQDTRAATMYFRQLLLKRPLRLVVSCRYGRWAHPGRRARAPVQAVPFPDRPARCALSRRTGTDGDRTLAVAVVAAQMALSLVEGVVVIAARALRDPAAVVAQQRRRKAAAVQNRITWLPACKC